MSYRNNIVTILNNLLINPFKPFTMNNDKFLLAFKNGNFTISILEYCENDLPSNDGIYKVLKQLSENYDEENLKAEFYKNGGYQCSYRLTDLN